jgi:formylmethanofuran dehydrogenase subunit E
MLINACSICEHDLVLGQYIIIKNEEYVCDACFPGNISVCDFCHEPEFNDLFRTSHDGPSICEECYDNWND